MAEQIIEYYRKHRGIIEENLELSRDPHDIEAIHQMRLSIKRMRVVARLAEIISKGKFKRKEQLKGTAKLFSRSGSLRDMQVALQLLHEYDSTQLQPVIDHIETRELKQRRRYEEVLSGFDISVFATFEENLTAAVTGVNQKVITHAAYTLLSELEFDIHRIYHGSNDEKRLHSIRRRLKDINYLNNIFDEALPVADHLNISVEKLRELGEAAGKWHDCLTLEVLLAKNIAKNPETSDPIVEVLTEVNLMKKGLHDEYVCILLNEMKI